MADEKWYRIVPEVEHPDLLTLDEAARAYTLPREVLERWTSLQEGLLDLILGRGMVRHVSRTQLEHLLQVRQEHAHEDWARAWRENRRRS